MLQRWLEATSSFLQLKHCEVMVYCIKENTPCLILISVIYWVTLGKSFYLHLQSHRFYIYICLVSCLTKLLQGCHEVPCSVHKDIQFNLQTLLSSPLPSSFLELFVCICIKYDKTVPLATFRGPRWKFRRETRDLETPSYSEVFGFSMDFCSFSYTNSPWPHRTELVEPLLPMGELMHSQVKKSCLALQSICPISSQLYHRVAHSDWLYAGSKTKKVLQMATA